MGDAGLMRGQAESSTLPRWRGSRRPVIMQVVSSLNSGGTGQSVIDLATGVMRAGGKAIVVSPQGSLVSRLRRWGAVHVELPIDAMGRIAEYQTRRQLVKLIREHTVDIVHQEGLIGASATQAASEQTGRPFIATLHRLFKPDNRQREKAATSFFRAERIVAVSEFVTVRLRALAQGQDLPIVTIPRGIDIAQFNPGAINADRLIQLANHWSLPDGAPVVLMPARIAIEKGQHVLVEAFALLNRTDVTCVLAGKIDEQDAYTADLLKQIVERGVGDRVKTVGECLDMPAAYMLADVVVCASTAPEAFGRVAVEAQAMGRPVIAADHGAARETVLQGRTGWLTPPGDARTLAATLITAVDMDAGVRSNVALVARRHVQDNYSVQRMCDQTFDLYEQILTARGAF